MRNVQLVEFMLVRRLLQRTQTTSIYEAEGGGMLAQKGDVDRVANLLHALRQELEALSHSTFPGEDKEQQRFLQVVRECEKILWGGTDGIAFRKDLPWGQAAREMQSEMQPLLREVCAMQCSSIWYLQKIHEIRALVDGICAWQEQAVAKEAKEAARQAAREAALAAAAAQEAAEAKKKKQERRARVVEARGSVTPEARGWGVMGTSDGYKRQAPRVLTAEESETVRAVVEALERDVFALESLLAALSREKLWYIQKAVAYLDSCSGNGTWIWNAEAWGAASEELTEARDTWRDKWFTKDDVLSVFKSLSDACDACIRDMQQYKALCGGVTPWYRSMFEMKKQLDALKELAEV